MSLMSVPVFPRYPLLEVRKWANLIQHTQIQMDAVPITLPNGKFQRIAGGLLFEGEYGYSEFQQQGLIFHEFDYWWEYVYQPVSRGARQLYPTVTAVLLKSALQLSLEIYRNASYFGLIDFSFEATALNGAFFCEPERRVYNVPKLVDSDLKITRRFSLGELEQNLLGVAMDCQRELYWAFGFDADENWLRGDFDIRSQ